MTEITDITREMSQLEKRMTAMEQSHTDFRAALEKNTTLTSDIKNNTDELVTMFLSVKAAAKVVIYTGKLAAAIAVMWGLYYAYTHNIPPAIKLSMLYLNPITFS